MRHDEQMPAPYAIDGHRRYNKPDGRQAYDKDTSYDRKKQKMSSAGQRKRSQRIDSERKDKAPPAEVEGDASSEITRSFEYREQKPPKAVAPKRRAADHAQAVGDLA